MKIIRRDQPALHQPGPLDELLALPPRSPDGIERSREMLANRKFPRQALADLLVRYNAGHGADEAALANARRLADADAVCVVTGQQLGFMGGPAYTILKAITCLLLAKESGAVPIFWAATEDHDLTEINHTFLLDQVGNLQRHRIPLNTDGRMVESLAITPAIEQAIRAFWQGLGTDHYVPHSGRYADIMIKLLMELFAGTGLVFVEPYLLRPLAGSFLQREITESATIASILQDAVRRYQEQGGEGGLEASEETNLFLIDALGRRQRIRRPFSQSELLNLVTSHPEHFSTNAAARTALQSALIPTLAYVAGPGELAYYHELKEYHAFHGAALPWVVPRLSATVLTPEATEFLEGLRLQPWDLIPERWAGLTPESAGVPSYALHVLRNLIHPQSRPQDRRLNWFYFQAQSKSNLIQELLKRLDWKTPGHSYIYL